MKKPIKTRVILDGRGLGRREREVEPGVWAADLAMDPARLRSLDPSETAPLGGRKGPVGHTPYGEAYGVADKPTAKQSRLDRLRALSEEIKRKRGAGSE